MRKISVSDFWLIWIRFREYLQIKIFFSKNPALSLFYLYSPLTLCKKNQKNPQSRFWENCYQLTNYYQQQRSYRTSLTPVQKLFPSIFRHAIHYTPFCNGTYKELENLLHLFFLFTYKYSYWIFIYGIQYADAPCTQQVNAYSKVSTHHDQINVLIVVVNILTVNKKDSRTSRNNVAPVFFNKSTLMEI